jgi:hypothetical protein
VAVGLERAKVVLFMRVVGVAKVVEHGDRLDDALDGFLAKRGDAGRHDGDAAAKGLSQLIIECANALSSGIHVALQLGLGQGDRRESDLTPSREAGVSKVDGACQELGLAESYGR